MPDYDKSEMKAWYWVLDAIARTNGASSGTRYYGSLTIEDVNTVGNDVAKQYPGYTFNAGDHGDGVYYYNLKRAK